MGEDKMQKGHGAEVMPDTPMIAFDVGPASDISTHHRFPDGAKSNCLPSAHLNINAEDVKNGLGRLVLTLVRLLHELLERQALRRIDEGDLTDAEIENLGLTFMKQAQEIERLRKAFNLEENDLNLDLGPLGKLL